MKSAQPWRMGPELGLELGLSVTLRLAEMRQSLNGHVPTVPRDTSAPGSHSSSFISWQMGSCPEMRALRDRYLWSLCCVTCPMSGEAQIPTQVVGSTRFQVLPLPHLLAKASPHFDPSHPTRASNPSTPPSFWDSVQVKCSKIQEEVHVPKTCTAVVFITSLNRGIT